MKTAQAPVKKNQQPVSGLGLGGVSDFFGNIFWWGLKNLRLRQPVQRKPTRIASVHKTAPSNFSTSVQKTAKTATLVPNKVARVGAVSAQGRYRLQIATVRSKEEANIIVSSIKRKDIALLVASHPARIEEAVVGNMGTFYRVRLESILAIKRNSIEKPAISCVHPVLIVFPVDY